MAIEIVDFPMKNGVVLLTIGSHRSFFTQIDEKSTLGIRQKIGGRKKRQMIQLIWLVVYGG